jgi:hypothetical protein
MTVSPTIKERSARARLISVGVVLYGEAARKATVRAEHPYPTAVQLWISFTSSNLSALLIELRSCMPKDDIHSLFRLRIFQNQLELHSFLEYLVPLFSAGTNGWSPSL